MLQCFLSLGLCTTVNAKVHGFSIVSLSVSFFRFLFRFLNCIPSFRPPTLVVFLVTLHQNKTGFQHAPIWYVAKPNHARDGVVCLVLLILTELELYIAKEFWAGRICMLYVDQLTPRATGLLLCCGTNDTSTRAPSAVAATTSTMSFCCLCVTCLRAAHPQY